MNRWLPFEWTMAVRFLRDKGFEAFQWQAGAADWISADTAGHVVAAAAL